MKSKNIQNFIKLSFVDWIGGWAKLIDSLALIFTLGNYNPRLNYKWYYSSATRGINGNI